LPDGYLCNTYADIFSLRRKDVYFFVSGHKLKADRIAGGRVVKKRKIRRYRHSRGNSGVKFVGILGIMVAAIICGYLTARFIIAPVMGYDTEVLKLDLPSRLTALIGEKTGEQDAGETGSYALQFGLFTSRAHAEALAEKLEAEDIAVSVRETEGNYQVISPLMATREEALEKLKDIETDLVSGVFITTIE
jgi:hypothetical protein